MDRTTIGAETFHGVYSSIGDSVMKMLYDIQTVENILALIKSLCCVQKSIAMAM